MDASFRELLWAFFRIGILSFGGPAAQIAVMHKELVEDRPWLSEAQFLNALSFCMLLPGPEAMQLATYCGWRLRGVPGGLIAGLLFVLPGALVMAALAGLYVWLGQVPLVEAVFLGVKAAVVVIVLQALLKVANKALRSLDRWVLAGLSFLAIFAFALPFPLIIATAALYGWLRGGPGAEAPAPLSDRSDLRASSPSAGLVRTVALWGALWWAPIGVLWLTGQELLTQVGLFFSKLAIVTFGGAYAVLAYMTQEVVQVQGWISTQQMMDGLGLAETTPGPLILVTEFVGFLAGYGAGGWGLALAAALLTVWVTFVPCFLWIFAGAPYIEWISTRPRLAGALQAITAAVVGVILNLSLWFATHVFFAQVNTTQLGPLHLLSPELATLDVTAALLAVIAGVLMLWLRVGMISTLLIVAALGVAGSYFV
ncbi:Chromate transporter [Candidatus Rhodobacter oscarellae]|uniref:Chromate transporter n=1 Tax=Candidatus Rhodobacter oscarellae TaxID=1675527 RepID=A0A0J9E5D9_9RHOB|nr:chromate efflux transporter [Candidatus Rhodobacter lobularis]KMW57039.1 Chromate transporter [Candidatus Rhodobacter lobularis]